MNELFLSQNEIFDFEIKCFNFDYGIINNF